MISHMRLDLYIVEKFGYSRNKAKSFVELNLVSINKKICNKPSYEVSDWDMVNIADAPELSWVSRSAGKLEGLLSDIWVGSLANKNALDIGSSTWGFSQILLAHDIAHVTAVDVGTDQLHPSIRSDSRVTSYENTDIRTFTPSETYDIITIDVSFISLREIVPVLARFVHENTDIYVLYKPQFEVGKTNLRKTGVPKDDKIIQKSLREFQEFLWLSGYSVEHLMKASVIGEAGNQEYMMHIVR